MGDTFTSPIETVGANPVIAVHAVLWQEASQTTTTIVSRPGTGGTKIGAGTAVAATEPGVGVTYPACPADGADDSTASLWDSNAKFLDGGTPNWGTADWIWNAAYPAAPKAVTGEVVDFTDTFNLGLPLGGSLMLTADNAYEAAVNGAAQGQSISVGPAFPGVLKEDVGSGPQVGQWGVASQGWQLVNQLALSGLKVGANTLTIKAANAYTAPGDNYREMKATPPQGYPDTVQPDTDGGFQCTNPAGLIYKLSVENYAHGESAWAGTAPNMSDFPDPTGRRTSPTPDALLETVTVPSTDIDGVDSDTTLASGTNYRFVVTGTTTWENRFGFDVVDAECVNTNGGGWLDTVPGYDETLLELQVNTTTSDWVPVGTPSPVEECDANHEYTLPFTGASGPVNFRIYDGAGNLQVPNWIGDNSGSLTVQIWSDN